jgi:hypothetical protein
MIPGCSRRRHNRIVEIPFCVINEWGTGRVGQANIKKHSMTTMMTVWFQNKYPNNRRFKRNFSKINEAVDILAPLSFLWSFCQSWVSTGNYVIALWRNFMGKNASWTKEFCKVETIQAGPSRFQCTQNVKLFFSVLWKVITVVNSR